MTTGCAREKHAHKIQARRLGLGHAYLFYLHVAKGEDFDRVVSALERTDKLDRHAAVNLHSLIGPVLVAFPLQAKCIQEKLIIIKFKMGKKFKFRYTNTHTQQFP
jgi:hypothetical protein